MNLTLVGGGEEIKVVKSCVSLGVSVLVEARGRGPLVRGFSRLKEKQWLLPNSRCAKTLSSWLGA